jgi:Flp pilus assembly protein TadG
MIARRYFGLGDCLRDERGVSVIEFAFLAPILCFMMLGMSDLARGYTRKMALEQAVHRALEKAAVGTVQTDYTFLKTEVKSALPDVVLGNITVDTWLMCDTTKMPTFQDVCGSRADGTPQEISRYVKLKVIDRWDPMFNYAALGRTLFKTGTDGKVQLSVDTSLRVQ